jgi:hypothetical protein
VRRVRLRQPPHAPRELHAERIVGTELAWLHLPHDEHRQRAVDRLTCWHGVALPRVTTSRAAMRSYPTPARPCFSAARMPFAWATRRSQSSSRPPKRRCRGSCQSALGRASSTMRGRVWLQSADRPRLADEGGPCGYCNRGCIGRRFRLRIRALGMVEAFRATLFRSRPLRHRDGSINDGTG